jgi:RNA polymerase primary sigma factor
MRLCLPRRSPSSPLDTYLHEIDATPLLTAEEEKALASRVAMGDSEARDHMARANLRLVVNIARSYQGKGMAMEDLIAEGNLGLMRAVEAFDAGAGTRFSTYASYWIKQSIKRGLLNGGKTVRVPAYMAQLLSEWWRASVQLQEKLGRAPEQDEVAGCLGLTKRKLNLVKKALRIHNAGQQPEQEETTLEGVIGGDGAPGPDSQVMAADELRQVLGMLGSLDDRAATVLRLRFGLGGEDPLSLQEIGDRIGCTRERVRQLEQQALRSLRELLQAS